MSSLFTKGMRRILALWFPRLPTDRIWRQRLGRSWRSGGTTGPLATVQHERNTQRIAALDARAETLGLKPGMGLADARAMRPEIETVPADPAADRLSLERLADWCERYTPLVGLDPPAGLFLDVTGSAHLFGGEEGLIADLARRCTAQGFAVRAGLAATPGAAWALARHAPFTIIEAGREAEALAGLPAAALRLEPETRQGLESVGLRLVGDLTQAPRAPLARRFDGSLLTRIDQALGYQDEPVSPRRPVPALSAERPLYEPIGTIEEVEMVVFGLGERLCAALERRGEGAMRLELSLFRADGAVARLGVSTSRPLREPRLFRLLFREKLKAGAPDAGYGFDLVRLCVFSARAHPDTQADFSGEDGGEESALALLADRIDARLGPHVLVRPQPIESHVPERAVALGPFSAPPRRERAVPAPSPLPPARPTRLFCRPERVEVTASVPEGPPLQFRWRRVLRRIARAEGPERIAPEWWREPKGTATRDYFVVEDEAGGRYWLYRQGLYGEAAEPPRWFVHGVFA